MTAQRAIAGRRQPIRITWSGERGAYTVDRPNWDGGLVYEESTVAALRARHAELVAIARALSLATDEGDDAAMGTHYIAKDGRIRCKGSFLELIERARAALATSGGNE